MCLANFLAQSNNTTTTPTGNGLQQTINFNLQLLHPYHLNHHSTLSSSFSPAWQSINHLFPPDNLTPYSFFWRKKHIFPVYTQTNPKPFYFSFFLINFLREYAVTREGERGGEAKSDLTIFSLQKSDTLSSDVIFIASLKATSVYTVIKHQPFSRAVEPIPQT